MKVHIAEHSFIQIKVNFEQCWLTPLSITWIIMWTQSSWREDLHHLFDPIRTGFVNQIIFVHLMCRHLSSNAASRNRYFFVVMWGEGLCCHYFLSAYFFTYLLFIISYIDIGYLVKKNTCKKNGGFPVTQDTGRDRRQSLNAHCGVSCSLIAPYKTMWWWYVDKQPPRQIVDRWDEKYIHPSPMPTTHWTTQF